MEEAGAFRKSVTQNTNDAGNISGGNVRDSCGRKDIGETPQCVSARGLTSHQRKAKYISGALVYTIFWLVWFFF